MLAVECSSEANAPRNSSFFLDRIDRTDCNIPYCYKVKELDQVRLEMIAAFVQAARLLGQPKSVGEIYGYLFTCQRPVVMDEIMVDLGISKGSASQGLRLLREVGAVRQVYQTGDRRDHYVAEVALRRLLRGYLDREIKPHLESGGERLARMEESRRELKEESDSEFIGKRIELLKKWHQRAKAFLPLLVRLAK